MAMPSLSPRLYGEVKAVADGDIANPSGSAWSLACVVADRKTRRAEPLTLRRSVPFSNHNYQLRFVMGGRRRRSERRLVVLPPLVLL